MTRERFATLIRWPHLFSVIGVLNVVTMVPQLVQILYTREVTGLNLWMFGAILIVQIGFSFQGFLRRDRTQTLSVGLAGVITIALICSVLWIRHG